MVYFKVVLYHSLIHVVLRACKYSKSTLVAFCKVALFVHAYIVESVYLVHRISPFNYESALPFELFYFFFNLVALYVEVSFIIVVLIFLNAFK